MKRLLLIALTMVLIASGMAQKAVYPLPLDSNVKLSSNAFCYALPTTVLCFDVKVVKIREIKGYYSEYAEKLLGLTNIISDNRTFYKIKDISIHTAEIMDDNAVYAVEPSSSQLKDAEFMNMLLERPKHATPASSEMTFTTASTPIPSFFKNYANVSYTETEDAFVETTIINGVVTQVPANRTRIVNKTADQKVQEAVDRITQIRKERNALIAGELEVPYTKETLELMLNKLNEAENDYLDLFRGITLEDEIHYKFYKVPETTTNPLTIFSMYSEEGLAIPADTTANVYQLQFIAHDRQELKPHIESKKPNNGYRFRRPQSVEIVLLLNGVKLHSFGIYKLDQWGVIETLPANSNVDFSKIGIIY